VKHAPSDIDTSLAKDAVPVQQAPAPGSADPLGSAAQSVGEGASAPAQTSNQSVPLAQ
jgi:preprotein translocase subunit SecG